MKSCRGTTLLGSLATVAILLILASMLFGNISASYEKARQITCVNNQHQLVDALLLYATDTEKFPTTLTQLTDGYLHDQALDNPSFLAFLSPTSAHASSFSTYYLNQTGILQCPNVKGSRFDSPPVYSYGYNAIVNGANYSAISSPSEIVIIADSDKDEISSAFDIVARHMGGAIAGYADGHVEWIKDFYPITGGPSTATSLSFIEDEICNNGFTFDYLGLTDNGDGTSTLDFSLTNDNSKALSNIAFELPAGVTATSPADGGAFSGSQNDYNIENTTENPFHSIKFETIGEGIKNGNSETFSFTLNNSDGDLITQMQVQSKGGRITGNGTFNEGADGSGGSPGCS